MLETVKFFEAPDRSMAELLPRCRWPLDAGTQESVTAGLAALQVIG